MIQLFIDRMGKEVRIEIQEKSLLYISAEQKITVQQCATWVTFFE